MMKENVRHSYEKLSRHYEFDVDTKPYNAYLERPAMIDLLPSLEGKVMLDAGCAAGWYASYAAKKGAQVKAIDMSASMIEATKRRTVDLNVEAFVHDLSEPLPFNDEAFDVVVSSLTLHYIKDWGAIFFEFHRILKKGGTLLFSTHHPLMDYMDFEVDDYYKTELLHSHWTVDGEEVPMSFFRRPLDEIIRPVTDSFHLEKLIEPKPTEDFKSVHPSGYEKVSKKPNFLIIRCLKP